MKQKTAFDWKDEPSIYTTDKNLRNHVIGVKSTQLAREKLVENLAKKKSITIYSLAKDKKETR
jgi:hypothetical protein